MKKKTKILLIISAIIGVALYLFVYRGYDSYYNGWFFNRKEVNKKKHLELVAIQLAAEKQKKYELSDSDFLKLIDKYKRDFGVSSIDIGIQIFPCFIINNAYGYDEKER